MRIKGIIHEDFVNYKLPSLYIAFPYCSFKCDKEYGRTICQNSALAQEPTIDIPICDIINAFLDNDITEAIVCGGLEPLDSWDDLQALIMNLRYRTNAPIIIYTGYNEDELSEEQIDFFKLYGMDGPILVKYGRFIPDKPSYICDKLGVELASPNQYTVRYSELRYSCIDDEELAKDIRKALKENNGYCPCAIEKTKDTLCMCKDFRTMEYEGTCHCGLYYKYYA